MDEVLRAARRYHDLGMAIIWLQPKSKRPVQLGWTTGERLPWDSLKGNYRPGMNIGVRLGSASKIGNSFLACLDVDIRGREFEKDAEGALQEATDEMGLKVSDFHEVKSGGGMNSRHLYFLTDSPFKQVAFGKGPVKKSWEVVAYSEGRQMVLPPSIHPETGKKYTWGAGGGKEFALGQVPTPRESERKPGGGGSSDPIIENWTAVPGARLLLCELPPKMRELIETGRCEDRSASLVPATRALMSIGASAHEILSVLTDPAFGLAQCPYDHAQTRDREKAVRWLWKYTVEKVWQEHHAPPAVFKKVERGLPAPEVETSWMDQLHRTREGQIKTDVFNTGLIIKHELGDGTFQKNEFTNRIVFGKKTFWGKSPGEQVTDEDIHIIQDWLCKKFEVNASQGFIWTGVIVTAKAHAFHPVREYLKSLEWDGVPRVDSWLKTYIGADMPEPYLSEVSRKFLLAAVARVFRPGCKFDHILVLEGMQGIGKSSVPQILASPAWFLGQLPNLRDKDSLIALQGAWFIEISELATLRRVDSESYKAFFSGAVDKFRAPYGRVTEEYPRQCVFMGTTNHEDYLSDNTGNRRFWPVKVKNCKFVKLKADRDQLWAEAYEMWKIFTEELYLTGEAVKQSEEIQQSRVAENEEMMLKSMFHGWEEKEQGMHETDRFDLERFRLSDLFEPRGPFSNVPKRNQTLQLAARVLKEIGFRKTVSSGTPYWRVGR